MQAPGLIPSLLGAPLAAGEADVGTIEDLLVCSLTGRPQWLVVRLRDCPQPWTLVPAARLASRDRAVTVPYDEDVVRAAPVRFAAPSHPTAEQSARLVRHYGLRAVRITPAVSLYERGPAMLRAAS